MIFKKLFGRRSTDKPLTDKAIDEIVHGHHIDAGPMTLLKMKSIIINREKTADMEFDQGYNLIKKYPRSVSILGSARFDENNKYYKQARSLANKIVTELKYAVVTGGGPGIMEAGNRGAYEAGGISLGFTIKLPKEQSTNPYVTDSVDFEYFFSRKTLIFFAAEAYLYFPGGFGTLDELLEVVTLIQTGKIRRTPVILVGKDFWEPIMKAIEPILLENNTIRKEETEIYKILDDENEIIEIIKNAPYREE